ncbi:MAG: class II aldolase/adducin family protein [Candidatus Baldrarchaeia archaeon]|nr:class II aldolase/adducin family protein [Candidatus Baldrarchaeota archaeon]
MLYPDLRQKIAETFRILDEKGLTYGNAGNISVRIPEENLFLITPSGVRKAALKPEDILVIDEKRKVIEGRGHPSIETPMHLAIYKSRKDVKAVIHAHPVYSSVFAVVGVAIPPVVEEMIILTGGEVEVAKYAPPGTRELANNVVEALGDRKAALLMNHGIITCGKDLEDALEVLICVERTAKIYLLSKLIGEPKLIPEKVIEAEKNLYRLKQKSQ